MNIKIEKLLIKHLYNKYNNIEWSFNDSVSVLVGDNGLGKSTTLQILYCLLIPQALENNPKIIPLFSSAELHLTNGYIISFTTKNKGVNPEIFNLISRIMEDSDLIKVLDKQINKKQRNKKQKIEIKTKINDILNFATNLSNDDISIVGKEIIITIQDKEGKRVKSSELVELFNIELVSTLFMNANSANEIKGSDGNVFTILDLEIDKQLARFNLMANREHLKDILTSNINKFLMNKKALFIDQNLLFELDDNLGIITLSDLSSGERQLIYILLKSVILSDEKSKTSILIMDEPEISLHLAWQEKLLRCLYDINPTSQIIVATHSPAIVMDGWMNSYKDMEQIISKEYE